MKREEIGGESDWRRR